MYRDFILFDVGLSMSVRWRYLIGVVVGGGSGYQVRLFGPMKSENCAWWRHWVTSDR
jgi:hypothetical protein